MAYSLKIKLNIMDRLLSGEPILKLAQEFKVARNTLYAWKKRGYKAFEPSKRVRVIDENQKREIIQLKDRFPKITLKKIKQLLNLPISLKSIHSYIKQSKGSSKRREISLNNYRSYLSNTLVQLEKAYTESIKNRRFKDTIEIRYCFLILFYKKGNFKTALDIAKKMENSLGLVMESLKANRRFNPVELYGYIGDCYHNSGLFSDANNYFEKYLSKLDENLNTNNISDILSGFSDLVLNSDIKRAERVIKTIKKSLDHITNDQLKIRVYWSIGTYFFKKRNYGHAKSHYEHLLTNKHISQKNRSLSHFMVAVCYKNLGQLSLSLKHLNSALHLNNNDILHRGKIIKERGLIYFRQHKRKATISSLFEAKRLFLEVENNYELIVTLYHICRYFKHHQKMKDYQIYYEQLSELRSCKLESLVDRYLSRLES